MAVLLGILRGYIKRQTHKIREEQRELMRWEIELERRASEIRKK